MLGTRPPFRWAGSKRRLLPVLAQRVPRVYGRYIEPFAGSAALFFYVAPKEAVLSDINVDLMLAYQKLRESPLELRENASRLGDPKQVYYSVRATDATLLDENQRAARFVFLNRYCFNGVFRTNRRGEFNVPMGTHTGALPPAIDFVAAAAFLRRAQLLVGDFEATLSGVDKGDFVYLDPPYFKGGRRGYGEYGYPAFAPVDVERLTAVLRQLDTRGARFLLSFTGESSVTHWCDEWVTEDIMADRYVSGFATGRARIREILVRNYE